MTNQTSTRETGLAGQTGGVLAPAEAAAGCCSTARQEVCCEPSEKAGCCGAEPAPASGCGCQ